MLQIIVTGCLGSGVTALGAGLQALGALGGHAEAEHRNSGAHDGLGGAVFPDVDAALTDALEDAAIAWPYADASLSLATLDPGTAERVGARLVDAFGSLAANAVVADGRAAHLLPLIRGAVPDIVTLVTVRRPARVARWAEHTLGTPLPVGFALWEVVTARALRGAAPGRVLVVDMDTWRADPRGAAADLVARLEAFGPTGLRVPDTMPALPFPSDHDAGDLDILEAGYATPGWSTLRQAFGNAEPVRPSPLAADVLRSHALLLDVERRRHAATRDGADAAGTVDAENTLARRAALEREHTLLVHERDALNEQLREFEARVAALHEELASSRGELDSTSAARERQDAQLRELSAHLADLVNETRHREAELQRRVAGVVTKLGLLTPRVRDMRSTASRYHDHEFEIYRLRSRVLKKEEAIRSLRGWMKTTNASVPLLPSALKDRIRFMRWNKGVTDENIKPLPKALDELRADADAKRERDKKRHRDIERELGRLKSDLDVGRQRAIVAEAPVSKISDVLADAGVPLRVVMSKQSPRRKPRVTSHEAKPRALVIYTAISGGYDTLKRPKHIPRDCDLVCFTDNAELRSDAWQMRSFDVFHIDPTRMARYVKTHPHIYFPRHRHSIWVDANLLIEGDVTPFLDALDDDHPFAAFQHPHRECIYTEAEEVIKRGGLDDARVIQRQVERYRAAGYPANAGLTETNVLVRRHDDARLIALMNAWWKEIDNGSKRDQLSLNYVAHQAGFEIAPLAERGTSVRNHPALQRFLHGAEEVKA